MENLAVLLAVIYLVLAIRENRWCWPAGIGSSLLYLGVFYGAGLYMQAVLQVFYAAMGVYGWWAWRPSSGAGSAGGADRNAALTIHRWPLRWHGVAIAAIVILALTSGALLQRYTSAESPYLDSLVTWSAMLTTWMVARKLIENWLYWFVIDAVTLAIALEQGLNPTAALFLLYLVLVVLGWRRWLAVWRGRAPGVPGGGP